jgi:hypothetical protein
LHTVKNIYIAFDYYLRISIGKHFAMVSQNTNSASIRQSKGIQFKVDDELIEITRGIEFLFHSIDSIVRFSWNSSKSINFKLVVRSLGSSSSNASL